MPAQYTLDPHFSNFVAAQLAAGRYADVDEVVRDALRLMEQRDWQRLQFLAGMDESFEDIKAGRVIDLHQACDEIVAEINAMPDNAVR